TGRAGLKRAASAEPRPPVISSLRADATSERFPQLAVERSAMNVAIVHRRQIKVYRRYRELTRDILQPSLWAGVAGRVLGTRHPYYPSTQRPSRASTFSTISPASPR